MQPQTRQATLGQEVVQGWLFPLCPCWDSLSSGMLGLGSSPTALVQEVEAHIEPRAPPFCM